MFQKRLWKFFLFFLALIALYFSIISVCLVYQYIRLEAKTVPQSIHWSVHAINEEHYVLKANYLFKVKDKEYANETVLLKPWYRNEWAASQEISNQMQKQWNIWFSLSNPESSSLQKIFPIKECVSSILLWGIFAYFVLLGFYMEKIENGTNRFKKL